ncbi:tuberin-like isoform X2 [Corticium candelabrum]|uniref:tuberin-like isoform X2 n=1 Tax=Corticium candelabrum TaxID=121492 RepID=UPI002E2F8930|nr:tuberin-like isoform X2 [Corticium candelabrum]
MAKDFKKKLQDLLFPKPPEDSHHELVISPDDVMIGTETVKELNSDNALQFRLTKLREITSVVARKRLEEHAVEAIWVAVQDLVQPSNPLEVRVVVLKFLKALIQGQYDHLQLLRDHFFHVVATHNIEEDFGYRLDILIELTSGGRNVTCFEEEIGPLLLDWMPVMAGHERLCNFLNLLVNIIHYNSTYLDDEIITGLVVYACAICDRQEPITVIMEACLTVFDSVLKYSCLPVNALHPVIFTLCHTVNREALCPVSWQLISNLLGTHLGKRGIFVLCSILEEEQNAKDALLLQGAVYFLGMSLWGARKVSALSHSYSSVLPSVKKALKSGHSSVVFEIVCSIDRLVRKYGQTLFLVTWDLITDILETVAKHVENEVSLDDGSAIAQHLHSVCCYIEDLCDRNCFTGCKERFFSLVEKLTLKRPELCALTLVAFRAESIMITSLDGMSNLCSLMKKYYQEETRTNVRIKALDVLSSVLSSCRYTFEDELIEIVVLPYLLPVHQDNDMAVRQNVTQLLVDLAYDCDTPHFFIIIDAIKRVANRELTGLRDQETDCHNVNDDEVDSEMEDVKTAVVGLICLFKWKLMHLPSSHCFCIYQSLIDHVQLQYQRRSLSRHRSEIRQKVFQCLLQLRSNSYRHLGYVNDDDDDGSEVFSNFVMCDGSSIDLSEEKRPIRLSSSSTSPPPTVQPPACNPINFVAAFDLILTSLQQESNKAVTVKVLEMLPAVLCNRNLILSCNADLNTLSRVLCTMASHQGASDLSSPGRQSRQEVTEFVYPVLYVVAMYPRQLERKHKHDLIKCIESGIRSRSSHAAIISLSQCCMEMPVVMARLLPSVLSTLAQLSATVALSLPVLEFLSNLSCLDEIFKGFHESQYRAIFATALPYTDPSTFSAQLVYLAYHTIFTWFVKTPLSHRKGLVKFILKGLYRSAGVSPAVSRQGIDIHTSQTSLKSPKLARPGVDGSGSDVVNGITQHEEIVEQGSLQRVKSVCEVSFHEEMREVCRDLMLRYTYANCFTQPRRSALASSLVNGGQAKHWLVGNAVVTITTSGTPKPSATSIGSTRGLMPSLSREDSAASSVQHSPVRSSSLFSGGDSWPCAPPTYDVSQCQGWAEVLVRRPTGNMAWMMKMENKQEHNRKSLPIPLLSSSSSGLQQDDLAAISSHALLGSFGLTPQSTFHSSGYLHHSVRQKTPVSMLSPIQQVFSTDVISDTCSDDTTTNETTEIDRSVFQLDSLTVNQQVQHKDSAAAGASISSRRSRRQLDFLKPSLGVSPRDHEHIMGDHHKTSTTVESLKSDVAGGTRWNEEASGDSIETSGLRSDPPDSSMCSNLCRYDSCPQLQLIERMNLQSVRSLDRQHSKEAEDVLLSPTSPHVDKILLPQHRAPILPLTFSCPQRQTSSGSTDEFYDPSFLFLQLYGQVFVTADEESQPILLTKSDV